MVYRDSKEYQVFPAERSIKSTKSMRKGAFDRVCLLKCSQSQSDPRPQEPRAMQAPRIPGEWLGHPRPKIPLNKLPEPAKPSIIAQGPLSGTRSQEKQLVELLRMPSVPIPIVPRPVNNIAKPSFDFCKLQFTKIQPVNTYVPKYNEDSDFIMKDTGNDQ